MLDHLIDLLLDILGDVFGDAIDLLPDLLSQVAITPCVFALPLSTWGTTTCTSLAACSIFELVQLLVEPSRLLRLLCPAAVAIALARVDACAFTSLTSPGTQELVAHLLTSPGGHSDKQLSSRRRLTITKTAPTAKKLLTKFINPCTMLIQMYENETMLIRVVEKLLDLAIAWS